jgi:hypothetical protein
VVGPRGRPAVRRDLGCGGDPAAHRRSAPERVPACDLGGRRGRLRCGGRRLPADAIGDRRRPQGAGLPPRARHRPVQPARGPVVHGRVRRGGLARGPRRRPHRDRHLPGAGRDPRPAVVAATARPGRLAGRGRGRRGRHADRRRRGRLRGRRPHPRRHRVGPGRCGRGGAGGDRRHARHGRARHEHRDGRARAAVRRDVRARRARGAGRGRHGGPGRGRRRADRADRRRGRDRRLLVRHLVPVDPQDRRRAGHGAQHLLRDVGGALRLDRAERATRTPRDHRMRRGERGRRADDPVRSTPTRAGPTGPARLRGVATPWAPPDAPPQEESPSPRSERRGPPRAGWSGRRGRCTSRAAPPRRARSRATAPPRPPAPGCRPR